MPVDAPLRPLHVEDAEVVAALVRRAFGAISIPLDPPPSGTRLQAADVASMIAEGGGAGWDEAVRDESGGGMLGSVLWRPERGGLYVGRLAVDPAAQKRGIAQALMAAAEREALARGLPLLRLKAHLAFAGNRRFFERCGFVETGREPRAGSPVPATLCMEKRLG